MAGLEPIATLEPMDAKSTWSQRAVAGSKWGKDGRQWDDSRRWDERADAKSTWSRRAGAVSKWGGEPPLGRARRRGERVERREEEAGGPLWHEEREPVGQLLLARAAAGGTTPRANSHEMIDSERVGDVPEPRENDWF